MSENDSITVGAITSAPKEQNKSWMAPFFIIWIGQALSLVGSQVGGFALVWWLTKESGGSATVLAGMTLIAMLPQVFLGPFVGALVDRLNRRRVMIVADSLIALFSAGLAVLAWLGVLEIWHVYVIMFIRSLGGTFHYAAMQASTSLMVPKSQLARVGGMNQTLYGVMNIITPPLGALLLEARLVKERKPTENRKLRETEAVIPEEKDPQDVLRNLHEMASESLLDIASFKPQAAVARAQYTEWPIELGVEGGYHDLGRFFDRIAAMPRLMSVSDLQIRTQIKPNGRGLVSASCVATAAKGSFSFWMGRLPTLSLT